jgi:transposase
MNPDAAGIDVGSREHWVAVPPDRDTQAVRCFGTFTAELQAMVRWLKSCGVKTVVMEATGVYWVSLFEVLEAAGLEVRVVNARYAKNVPGRKSDILDCQWLQKLHTYGLLPNSFRPAAEIRVLRSYMRQRENLCSGSHQCVQHIQKALTEMNVRLVQVLNDIMGVSGRRILQAILNGERDTARLAGLVDRRVKTSMKEIRQSLEGDWREEQLFIVAQQWKLLGYYEEQIEECDRRIQTQLRCMQGVGQVADSARALPGAEPTPKEGEAVHESLHRLAGVDLTRIEGVDIKTAEIVLSEVGVDMSRWPSEKHFSSWLGLSPNHQITGGKVLRRHTRPVVNRASTALRRAAFSLLRSRSALGAKYRRLRSRLGAPKAVTAIAHHLACLIYRMIRFGHEYVAKGIEQYEAKYRKQQLQWLKKRAAELNMQLVECQTVKAAVANLVP